MLSVLVGVELSKSLNWCAMDNVTFVNRSSAFKVLTVVKVGRQSGTEAGQSGIKDMRSLEIM